MALEADPEPTGKKASWLPSPKKFGEFILATIQIQRSVESLRKDNEKLTTEIKRLQRQVDEQAGQLKTIQAFIQSSVYENAARSGERAAMQFIEQMMRPAVEDKKKR